MVVVLLFPTTVHLVHRASNKSLYYSHPILHLFYLRLFRLGATENKKVEDEVVDKRRNLNFVKKFI